LWQERDQLAASAESNTRLRLKNQELQQVGRALGVCAVRLLSGFLVWMQRLRMKSWELRHVVRVC